MALPLRNPIIQTNTKVRLKLRHSSDPLVVWWYCGLYKNTKDNSQPQALVAFRKLLNSSHVSDEVVYDRVPLTWLGQLRIGSIWKNGQREGELRFESYEFAVDFTRGYWDLNYFPRARSLGAEPPYPLEIHPLPYKYDKNWLLKLFRPQGGNVVVPCLEFFTRCYGRSAELRRLLATYPWEELWNERLYAPLNEPEELEKWKVRLRQRLTEGDALLAAHAKYDGYTQSIVKQIYSQAEANYDPEGITPAFIQIKPWFEGPARIKAEGIWFNNRTSFLALRLCGSSDPDGSPIWRGGENSIGSDGTGAGGGDALPWAGQRRAVKKPDIVDLTDEEAPDSDTTSAGIEDPKFEVLGTPRIIRQLRRTPTQVTPSGKKGVSEGEASRFSSGDSQGRGKGVGYADIHTKPVLETEGMLRDMWNAMLFLKTKYPQIIQAVEWFTPEKGYHNNTEPQLIPIEPFDESDIGLDSLTWKWPFMDTRRLRDLRGVLIIRVISQGKAVYIFEIQRRTQKKKNKTGQPIEGEESFRGLAFTVNSQRQFAQCLTFLLSEVRMVRGVVKELVERCPGNASSFMHTPASSDQVSGESAARNALRKMGVIL